MGERRSYDQATIAALMVMCRGTCYAPGCRKPVATPINGVPRLEAEIAHIRAVSGGGPRFDETWTLPERNSFRNLIILCRPHHKEIDGTNAHLYPVEMLEEWKADREGATAEALMGLTNLTEDRLGQMLAEVQGQFLDEMRPALAEFSKHAPRLAALLGVLVDELADPRVHGFGIPPGVLEDFAQAAQSLRGLEDNAHVLRGAAERLTGLEDNARSLHNTARRLANAAVAIQEAASVAQRAANAMGDRRYR